MTRRPLSGRLLSIWLGALGVSLLLMLTPILTPGALGAAGDCSVGANEAALDSEEQEMLRLINEYRASRGLGPLTASAALNRAAAWLANDMARRGIMSHYDSLGRGLNRLRDCGYLYSTVGENVAYGSGPMGSAQFTFNSWRNSPGHNANMLNGSYRAVGIGRACNGACYWALDLGSVVDDGSIPSSTLPSSSPVTSPAPPTSTPPQDTGTLNNFYSNTGTTMPTYYTPSSLLQLWSWLLNRPFWVYSNGTWSGYNPFRLSVSDSVSPYRSGFYYFSWR